MTELIEDLRFFIGAFFLIVGGLLAIEGLSAAPATGDLNLNLWTGAAFACFAAVIMAWAFLARRA